MYLLRDKYIHIYIKYVLNKILICIIKGVENMFDDVELNTRTASLSCQGFSMRSRLKLMGQSLRIAPNSCLTAGLLDECTHKTSVLLHRCWSVQIAAYNPSLNSLA